MLTDAPKIRTSVTTAMTMPATMPVSVSSGPNIPSRLLLLENPPAEKEKAKQNLVSKREILLISERVTSYCT